MFLPIGDKPNPKSTPVITWALIGINIAIFLFVSLPLMLQPPDLEGQAIVDYLVGHGIRGPVSAESILERLTAYSLFTFQYGYRPAEGSIISLISSLFLHGGWMHLAGNMLFLWIFGDNVEHRLGHLRYLLLYLVCGISATLFFALFVPGSNIPLIGASGAISGILGCYFLWFPKNQVKVFIMLFPILMQSVFVPARLVLGFYLVLDNLLPFLLTGGGGGSGVAHGAHIGGFLAGGIIAYGVNKRPEWQTGSQYKGEKKREKRRQRDDTGIVVEPLPEKVIDCYQRGSLDQAVSWYMLLPGSRDRQQVPQETRIALGNHLLADSRWREALTLFRRFIAENQNSDYLGAANLGAGRALIRIPRSIPAAYHYFLDAVDTTGDETIKEEARMHLHAIEKMEGHK